MCGSRELRGGMKRQVAAPEGQDAEHAEGQQRSSGTQPPAGWACTVWRQTLQRRRAEVGSGMGWAAIAIARGYRM